MTVRQAVEADYETLCVLFEGADRQNCARAPHVYKPPQSPSRPREYLTAAIAGGPSSLLVVERDGAVVGMARVAVTPVPQSPERTVAQVGHLYVREDVRRERLGGELMHGCHAWIHERGGRRIYVPVPVGADEATPFFHQLGYKDRADIDNLTLSETDPSPTPRRGRPRKGTTTRSLPYSTRRSSSTTT